MANKVIGIDLGTGNSCVSVIENGKPVVVANSEGGRTTPSVVSLKDGERKVGQAANRQRVVYPNDTVYNIKRFMGNDYSQCENVISKVPYKVNNVGGKPRIEVGGREYSPEEISSFILAKMKQTAEDYLGETVTDAVITCPAWFDNVAREATKLAGEMCGLKVLRIINEPTAAILSSNLVNCDGNIKVMVADIGCGTTDFSICDISDGVVEILGTKGDVFLGGSDFDNAITEWVINSFKGEHGIDLTDDKQALTRIIEASEKAKIELSTSTSTEINLPYITVKDNVPLHLTMTLTRAKMEQLTSHLVDRIVECAKGAMTEAKVDNSQLNYILLVGGQSRSLAIQEALRSTFGTELNKSVNPDEAVSMGAAIQANIIVGGEGSSDVLLLDVTPLTLGIETMGGVMTALVEANTTIPCTKSQTFTTAQDNQSSVSINVLQGERPMATDNKSIGMFILDGILPAKRGVPQIEVKFDIDANGIVSVSATDKATGKEQRIRIESSNSLDSDEVERIKREAEEHAAEDKRTKDRLDNMNKCESLIYQTETSLETSDKLKGFTEEDRTFFNGKLEELKKMKETSDYSMLDSVSDEVTKRWQSISLKSYDTGDKNDAYQKFASMFGGSNPFGNMSGGAPFGGGDDIDEQDAK